MAFGALGAGITGLLGGIGEARQRKYDRDQAAQALALQKQQLADDQSYRAQQEADEQRRQALTAAQAGYDPNTLKPIPVTWDTPETQQERPNNGGKGGPATDAEMSKFYQARALRAAQEGNYALAQQYADAARTAAQNAQSFALAGKNTADATIVDPARAGLLNSQAQEATARASYYKGKNGIDLQIARLRLQGVTGANAAHIQAAQIAATARMQAAGLSAQAQEEGRVITGWYMLNGRTADDATRLAVANAQDAERYAQAQGTATGAFGGLPAAATAGGGNTTVNVPPIDLASTLKALGSILHPGAASAAGGTSTGTANVPPPPPPPDPTRVTRTLAAAQALLKSGKTPHEVRQMLNDAVKQGALTAAEAAQIEARIPNAPAAAPTGAPIDQLHLPPPPIPQRTSLAPLPVGGSQGAPPFLPTA